MKNEDRYTVHLAPSPSPSGIPVDYWRIVIKTPGSVNPVATSWASRKWVAKLKARWIVWQLRRGKFKDPRRPVTFKV